MFTVILDTNNGINNDLFAYWVKNYGLSYVEVDEYGDVCTRSNFDICDLSEVRELATQIAEA